MPLFDTESFFKDWQKMFLQILQITLKKFLNFKCKLGRFYFF